MTVHGLPSHVPEPWLTKRELAKHFSVSISTVENWRRAGMPSQRYGHQIVRFQVSACVAWLRAQRTAA